MEQPQTLIPETNSSQQTRSPSEGPIAIFWDIENCSVSSDLRPEDVAGNIRMAVRVHPIINGAVTTFSAYGDFNAFPRRLREGCQRTGVKLIDVPNGRKDAADKAILVDMFLFALDNPPPASIMLISGDVDFSPALHVLGQRGYIVILVIPARVGVSSALCNAGSFVWDWSSVARGEGFVPPSRCPPVGPSEVSGFPIGAQISGDPDVNTEEEAIVLSDMWGQPGDLTGLTGQLVKLLELSGGSLPLDRLPAEYQKKFGRRLYVSDYGTSKLAKLLKKMSDLISVEGKGQKKLVCLKKCSPEAAGVGSSEEFSGDEKAVSGETLGQFKYELQEILVSYSCRVFLGCFEAVYQQRYKRPLEFRRFGVNNLDELFEKVNDIVVLLDEPASKRKFLVPAVAKSGGPIYG